MGYYACPKVFHHSQGKEVAHYYHSNLLPISCGCGHVAIQQTCKNPKFVIRKWEPTIIVQGIELPLVDLYCSHKITNENILLRWNDNDYMKRQLRRSQLKRNQPRRRWHMWIDSLRENAQRNNLNSFDGPFP